MRALRPREVLLAAVCFGTLAGLLELAYLAYRKLIAEEFLWVSRDVVWMAPLGDVLVCAAGALLLMVAARFAPSVRATASLLAGLAGLCVFMLFHGLHPIASLALAAGLGLQVGRVASRRADGFVRLVRRSAPWLAGLVVLLGAGVHVAAAMRTPGLAAPPEGRPPNIVLMTLDTVRAESMGLYGYERPTTPELEKLAARGVLFERAIASAPWTLPSHATMFTGRFPFELSVDWMAPLDEEHPTLAEALRARGYATAGFASNLNYCSAETGLARGFTHYEDYPVSFGQLVLSTALGRALTNAQWFRGWLGWHDNLNRKTATRISRDFADWVSAVEGRPFFAFLNYYDGHQPYLPPPEFAERFVREPVERSGFRYDTNLIEVENWFEISPEQVRMEQDCYDAAIAYIDAEIGALVRDLEGRGLLENTLLIVTSDHGEQFGEHELYNHGNSLYLPAVHVPLLMLLPGGRRGGTKVEAPVSLRDLPATILEMAGATDGDGLGGHTLARFWDENGAAAAVPNVILSEVNVLEGGKRQGHTRALLAWPLYFILNGGDDSVELYDIDYDYAQKIDLSDLRVDPDEAGSRVTAEEAKERFAEALDLILHR